MKRTEPAPTPWSDLTLSDGTIISKDPELLYELEYAVLTDGESSVLKYVKDNLHFSKADLIINLPNLRKARETLRLKLEASRYVEEIQNSAGDCVFCGAKTRTSLRQTRSADEASTLEYTCGSCRTVSRTVGKKTH